MNENDADRETQSKNRTLGLSRRTFLAGTAGVVGVAGLGAGTGFAQSDDDMAQEATTFTVRIENASKKNTLETSGMGDASKQAVPLSPGAYAVFDPSGMMSGGGPIFTAGEADHGDGLEAIAEDGQPMQLAQSLANAEGVTDSGAFATPVGADEPGPLTPGGAYEFEVEASPGYHLSFATMFIPSNDLFYSPDDRGIALFDGDEPLSGDVTNAIDLWDAGTEVNEEPGVGPNQVQRQSGPDTGETEDGVVRLVAETNDGYDYPYISEVIRVTLHSGMM